MKSNINIVSNVYIRSRENIVEDRPFINAVQGARALKLLRDDYLYGLSANMQLGDLQNKELVQGVSCSLAVNGEFTHGKVYRDGKLEWVGRCEYTACDKFSACPATWRVKREWCESTVTAVGDTAFKFLGEDIAADSDEELATKQSATSLDVGDVIDGLDTAGTMDADNPLDGERTSFYNKFQCVNEPTLIVTAPIDSRILVNAAPGTGKTYSAILRLLYILKNNLARPEKILVLCYSRAAVKAIQSRIANGVEQGELPPEANKLGVCTFYCLANKYLAEWGLDGSKLGYHERIELFNNNLQPEYFSKDFFDYLIVDELQDLVDTRAQMVLGILANIQCGYLLLGDRCQAIYDFDSVLSSVDFYKKLQEIVPMETQYYELQRNNRQTDELAGLTDKMRTVLLQAKPAVQNNYANSVVKSLKVFASSLDQLSTAEFDPTKRTAILCRNNGEVLRICGVLCNAGIGHCVLRGHMAKPKYKRFLADIFWDFVLPEMSQGEFCRRYIARVHHDSQEATQYFAELCQLTESGGNTLNIAALRYALLQENQAGSLTIRDNDHLTISTIHRAKGKEFDIVYLLKYSAQMSAISSEEARVRYVAMTRAKETLQQINIRAKALFRKEKNRYYRIAYRGKYFKSKYWCSGISVCHDDDIEQTSFVSVSVHENVFYNQQYIAEHVRRYDQVEAVYCERDHLYHIVHAGRVIGTLAVNSAEKFWEIVRCTSDRRNIPKKLTELFVYDVYTVVAKDQVENLSSIHQQSRIWLGLDIVGMGRANYNDYS